MKSRTFMVRLFYKGQCMSIYDSIKVDLEHDSECAAFADCLNVNFEKPFMIIGLVGAVLLIVYQSLGRYVFATFLFGRKN